MLAGTYSDFIITGTRTIAYGANVQINGDLTVAHGARLNDHGAEMWMAAQMHVTGDVTSHSRRVGRTRIPQGHPGARVLLRVAR